MVRRPAGVKPLAALGAKPFGLTPAVSAADRSPVGARPGRPVGSSARWGRSLGEVDRPRRAREEPDHDAPQPPRPTPARHRRGSDATRPHGDRLPRPGDRGCRRVDPDRERRCADLVDAIGRTDRHVDGAPVRDLRATEGPSVVVAGRPAQTFGAGNSTGRVLHTLDRLERFGITVRRGDIVGIRLWLPPLTARQRAHLPEYLAYVYPH